VLLVVGFAVADSLRNEAAGDAPEPRRGTTEGSATSTATVEEGEELGRSFFPTVSGAGGVIVIAETGSCAVREFDLPTGLELPNVVARSTCQIWAAPVTGKMAVGVGEPVGDAVPFRFIDTNRPGRDLGASEALFGILLWSDDGQRAAWCTRRRVGIDLELGAGRRRLPDCPAAYIANEVAFTVRNELLVEDGTVLTASGWITSVHFGRDGSIGVVVEGRRIERYVDARLTHALDLLERFQGRLPELSPDNCSALFRARDNMQLLDVGCSPSQDGILFAGATAAWSPDGRWIAVGGPTELTFVNLLEGGESVTWPVGAAQIAWRRG